MKPYYIINQKEARRDQMEKKLRDDLTWPQMLQAAGTGRVEFKSAGAKRK